MTLDQFLTLGPGIEIEAKTATGVQTFTVARFPMIDALDSKGEMCQIRLYDVVGVLDYEEDEGAKSEG